MLSTRRIRLLISLGVVACAVLWLVGKARGPFHTGAVSVQSTSYAAGQQVTGRPVGYTADVLDQPDPSRYVGLVESGGANSLRDGINWQTVEPTEGRFYWTYPDEIVAQAATHHLHVLLMIETSPLWASGGSTSNPDWVWLPPRSAVTYGAFAAAVATRYGAGGTFWKQHPQMPQYLPTGVELWNEENTNRFWGGETPNPALYAQMVKAAYTGIKHVDPSMTVVTGGLAAVGSYDNVTCSGRNGTGYNAAEWNGLNYLQALYADGIHGYFDAVGWHPYIWWNHATSAQMLTYNRCSGWSEMAASPVSVRSLMTANGDADKQVWATEAGAPTCVSGATYICVSQSQQYWLATIEMRLWKRLSWAGGYFWYDIRDDQLGAQNVESHFGAVSYPDSAKPVYNTLRQAWG